MKRLLQLSIFIFVSGCFIFSTDPEKSRKDKRPNFSNILVDDLGYSNIAYYGSEIATPNIDLLAKEGVQFTKFYNTSRCCQLVTFMQINQTSVKTRLDKVNINYFLRRIPSIQ